MRKLEKFGKMTRRGFFGLGLAGLSGLGGLGYGFLVESRWLEVSRVRIKLPKSLKAPIRIAHLSDLHWSSFVSLSFIEKAIEIGLGQNPDFVCVTGDFVTAGDEMELDEYTRFLRGLSSRVTTFGVLGNHDGGSWSKVRGGYRTTAQVSNLLDNAGFTLLSNRSTTIDTKGGRLTLVGTDDLRSGSFRPSAAFKGVEKKAAAATILLAHNPDSKDYVGNWGWDLMLSGHTHGGQIVVPFLGAPVVPVRDRRYIAGLNPWKDRLIYTTRGVGNLLGIRLNCRPQISILDLA